MRVAILGPTFPYKGGIALHTTDLAHRMAQRGDDVMIETWLRQYPRRLYPGVQELDHSEGAVFHHVRRRLAWNRPDGWWRIGRQIGRSHDVIVLALVSPVQFPAYETLARAARRSGARVIAIAHNVLPHEPSRFDRLAVRHLYSVLDGLLVHSAAEQALARSLGASTVVSRALPFFFEAAPPGPRPQSPIGQVAFIGFVRPYKGLDVLVEALALTTSRPRLVVHGEFWEGVDRYVELATKRDVVDLCEFVPGYATSDDLAVALDASDALIVPYRSATGSQHPRVARSRGIASIVTDVGDLASQVSEGIDGFVVRPNDPHRLAAAIDALYGDGMLSRLAATIRPVDVSGEWDLYLEGLDEVISQTGEQRR